MKKYFKRYCALALSVIMILTLIGCSSEKPKKITFKAYSDMDFDSDDTVSSVVCENEKWCLIWDASAKRVSFKDKATDKVWGQIPAEAMQPAYGENGMIKKNHPQLESAVQVIYQDPKSFDDVSAYSYTAAVQSGGVYCQKIENGIRVIYEFVENEFSVPVDYTIGEKSFAVSVDPKSISEGEEFKIHSIALAPFVCGVKNNTEDSWLFIPDGSGAIILPSQTDGVGTVGEKYVYGKDLSYQDYGMPPLEQQVNMPVFGLKNNNNAILAVITSGAEKASINWNIGSENIGYSSVYAKFMLRGFSYIKRPENFVTTTTLGAFKIFDDGIITDPIKIEYYPLYNEKADIYGMAECYRNYLTENAGLKSSASEEKSVALKYIGATVQPAFFLGIPTTKLFPLTTCEQALKMTDEISKSTGTDISVNLAGFGESGFDAGKVAGGFKVSDKLGGKKGMSALAKSLNNKGIEAFMDFDIISFSKSGGGFSKSSAATYPGGQIVKYNSFDTVSKAANKDMYFVLSRKNLFKASKKVIDICENLSLSGISYSSLSKVCYSDYSNNDYYICGKMPQDVTEIFTSAQKSGYKVLSSGANDYAAISSDRINDVPLYSSDYVISSCDVPFYQMVFKGYRPMSSVSLNLCADYNDALLRCIAGGISPSYTLYYNYDNELFSSEHSFIFGSVYSGNKDRIIATVKETENYFKSIKGAKIIGYTRLSKDVSVTRFDNGVYTVVNFGDKDAQTEYGKVSAGSYLTGRE